jgi:hypothetical protein
MRKRSKQENPHDRKNSQFVNSRPIKQGSAKTRSTQVFSSTMFQPSGNRSSQESPFCERLMCAIMSCNLCTPETEGNRNKKTPDSRIQIDVVAIAVAERCSLGCSPAGLVRNSKAAPGHAPAFAGLTKGGIFVGGGPYHSMPRILSRCWFRSLGLSACMIPMHVVVRNSVSQLAGIIIRV